MQNLLHFNIHYVIHEVIGSCEWDQKGRQIQKHGGQPLTFWFLIRVICWTSIAPSLKRVRYSGHEV